jgi:GT2 family glycosyltransferase
MAALQTKPEISIIVINYNTDELVLNLLNLLDTSRFELIVIDNSDKKTLEDKLNHYKNTRYYFMGQNLGFGRAANYGASIASTEWLFFLNSDTKGTVEQIESLLEITKKYKAQVAAPQLISQGHVENTVGIFDSFLRNPLNHLFGRPHFADCSKVKKPTFFHLATAGALLIQRQIFENKGAFDRDFFMYFEDIDLSLRLHKNNIPVLYVPEVKIEHTGGASSKDSTIKNDMYKQSLNTYLQKNKGSFIATINSIFNNLK